MGKPSPGRAGRPSEALLPFGASEVPGCCSLPTSHLFISFSPSASVLVRNHLVASGRKANSKQRAYRASGAGQVGRRLPLKLRCSTWLCCCVVFILCLCSHSPASTSLSFPGQKSKIENMHGISDTPHRTSTHTMYTHTHTTTYHTQKQHTPLLT